MGAEDQIHLSLPEVTMNSLVGKVAIITGASSGIGAATAIHFAKLGATLSLTGRNAENLQDTAKKCIENGAKDPIMIQADLVKEADCVKIIEETVAKYGKFDVLVNNAGVLELGSIENTSLEQYDRVMNINVRSIYHLTMLAGPHLEKTQGNSVNVIRSFPGVLAYNISKAAVDQFTRCVALELAPKKIRVNSVNPGVIATELQKRGGLDGEKYDKFLEHSKTTHAMGRTGEALEVAKAIGFLASVDASFSTGVILPVDGGRHAMCPR